MVSCPPHPRVFKNKSVLAHLSGGGVGGLGPRGGSLHVPWPHARCCCRGCTVLPVCLDLGFKLLLLLTSWFKGQNFGVKATSAID